MRGYALIERSSLHAIDRASEVFAETPKLGGLELPDNRRHTIARPDCVSPGDFAIRGNEEVFFIRIYNPWSGFSNDSRSISVACRVSVDPCDVGWRQLLA